MNLQVGKRVLVRCMTSISIILKKLSLLLPLQSDSIYYYSTSFHSLKQLTFSFELFLLNFSMKEYVFDNRAISLLSDFLTLLDV